MRKTKTKDPLFLSLQGAVLVVALGVPLFLFGTNYDNFIDLVLERLDRGPYRVAAEAYFPEYRFRLFRWITLALGSLATWIIFKYQNRLQSLFQELRITTKQGYQSVRQMLHWQLPSGKFLVLLLSVSFLRISYYIITMPLIYDECWTFLNFTRHGPLSAVLTYPSSNNHILVSLASSILYMLHLPAVVALRLPVLLFGLLSILIFYKFLSYFFDHGISCIVTTFYSCSMPISLYMVLARGYVPICLCYLILLHEVFVQKRIGILFIFASILGFYSVPTFFYPFSLIIGYLITEVILLKRPIYSVLKPFTIIIISVAVLYAPFMATKTFGLSIQKNTAIFATQINSQFILAYLTDLSDYLLSSDYIIPLFCIGLLTMAFRAFIDKIRPTTLLLYSTLTIFSPIFFIVTQELRIPLRIFTFLAVHVGVIAGYMLAPKGGKPFTRGGLVYPACIFIWILFVGLFHSHSEVRKLVSQNDLLHQVSTQVLEEGRNSFFLDYEVIKPILSYNAALKKQHVSIKMAQENSLDYMDFSLSDHYDVLIIDNSNATIGIEEIPLDIYDKVTYEDFTLFQRSHQ